MPYLARYKDGRVLLRIYVQPRASQSRLVGLHDHAVKLAITAAPVDGKANDAVIRFLAAFLNVKKNNLEIKNGLQSRSKSVLVAGLDAEVIRTKIETLFNS